VHRLTVSPAVLVVPPGHEVQHDEEEDHHQRDEQDGSHRLVPLLLRRRVTSGLLLTPTVVIGERLAAVDSSSLMDESVCAREYDVVIQTSSRPSKERNP
jgi:hypothetical protein